MREHATGSPKEKDERDDDGLFTGLATYYLMTRTTHGFVNALFGYWGLFLSADGNS